jgi:acyl carrier protein
MNDTNQIVLTIIAEILGVEPSDITEDADFTLDLNATPEDLNKMKANLEDTLDIVLPELDQPDLTVSELMGMVEDSLL